MTRTILLMGMAGSLLWAAGSGCGDDEHRPSEMLAGWQGPPPRINITATGPDADDDKREKCNRIARDNGIMVDPGAPIQGTLILGGGGNRLSITVNGAPVREDQKPDWSMDQLCNDAILQLLSTARNLPQGGMAAGGYAAPAMATVVLTGPEADGGKRERCNRIVTQMGGSLDPNVAVRAVLNLAESGNALQVISARRGIVFNQNKPSWGMEQLCQDAMQAAQSFLQQEMAGGYQAPPPGYNQPPPPPAYQPPPPQQGGWGFGITIAGPEADDDKRQKCQRAVAKRGGNADSNSAAVTALLYLRDGGNTLQIISKRRGIVSNQPRPGWSMDRLCEDAATNAQMALQQESAGGPPPSAAAPPPGAPAGTIAVSPMPASNGAPKNVADLAQRGLADFGRRDYANALVAFAEAARTSGDPALLFDTGLCYYMLHRPQEALQHLQLYVDRAPQAANRAQADALIGDLHRQTGMDE